MSEPAESRESLLRIFVERHGLDDIPPAELDLALTHRSYAFENGAVADNERLEFLGDAILSAVTSEHIYTAHPREDEGQLSKRRARLVSRQALGVCAAELGLGPLLLLGVGETRTGGGRRRSILGGALEALIAVLYISKGHDRAREFILRHVLAPAGAPVDGDDEIQGDYKSALQEWAQRIHGCLPRYHRLAESGPDHSKLFSVEVEIKGERLAQGTGNRVKTAENEAARLALERIRHPETDAQAQP